MQTPLSFEDFSRWHQETHALEGEREAFIPGSGGNCLPNTQQRQAVIKAKIDNLRQQFDSHRIEVIRRIRDIESRLQCLEDQQAKH
jgi:hypothetical protein